MRLLNIVKVCPGKQHAWYETNLGFRVRKPIAKNFDFDKAMEDVIQYNSSIESDQAIKDRAIARKAAKEWAKHARAREKWNPYIKGALLGAIALFIIYVIFFS